MFRKLGPTFVVLFGVVALALAQGLTTTEKLKLSGGNCTISSGASAPSGGSTCDVYVKTDGTLYINSGSWTPVATGGDGTLSVQVTLTDAQVKTLPTTPVQLVAAPGMGFRVRPFAATIYGSSVAGAYTNVDTTYSTIQIENSGLWLSIPIVNDVTAVPALTRVSTILGGNEFFFDLNIPYIESNTGWIIPVVGSGRSQFEDVAVTIAMDNNGTGNLTGGNAANFLSVTLYYVIEPIVP